MFLPPSAIRKLPNADKFYAPVVYSSERIDFLREAIANDTLPPKLKAKWNTIMALPSSWTVTGAFNPWFIPENYSEESESNQERLAKFRGDTQAACGYAFRYLVYGDEADAELAMSIVDKFSDITVFETNAGSTLNWFDGWGLLIQVVLMLKDSPAATTTLVNRFKAVVSLALATLEPIAYTRENNWASWGLSMEFCAALLLQDRPRFDKAILRWYSLFDASVVSNYRVQNGGPAQGQRKDNVPYLEIYRMGGGSGNGAYGLLYSAFHLDGLTLAAEWARIGGVWLYDHVAPDGSSLKGFWEAISYQKRYGAATFSIKYLETQWYNTSNLDPPSSSYYYSGYYTNRVGGSFYILQELWPLQTAYDLMNGGFTTDALPAGMNPNYPTGRPSTVSNGVGILEDYYGMYGADLAYWGRPLYG